MESLKIPLSVNIVFNIFTNNVILSAARNNEFKYRRIEMTSDFTRIEPGKPYEINADGRGEKKKGKKQKLLDKNGRKVKNYGKSITSPHVEPKLGGSLDAGIFVLIISRETEEILLKE